MLYYHIYNGFSFIKLDKYIIKIYIHTFIFIKFFKILFAIFIYLKSYILLCFVFKNKNSIDINNKV